MILFLLDLIAFLVDLSDSLLEFLKLGRHGYETARDLGLLTSEPVTEGVSLLK